MKLLVVIILFFQADVAAAKQDSKRSQHLVTTEFGPLLVECAGGSCGLRLDEQPIEWEGKTAAFSFSGAAHQLLSSLRFWSHQEDYLISFHQNAGCPVEYQILRILGPDRYEISDRFGNCSQIEMMGTAGIKFIEFYLPSSTSAKRESTKFLWHLGSSKIYQQIER